MSRISHLSKAGRLVLPALPALAMLCAPLAAHELTPTTIYEVPFQLDGQSSSVLFGHLLGPPAGENIWHTRLELSWINTGPTSASAFSIELASLLAGGSSPVWLVTGAQLGWGAAPGTYTGTVASDILNGEAAPFFFLPNSSIAITVDAVGGGGLWGQLSGKLIFVLGPRLQAEPASLSLSAGGVQTLSLNAGPLVGPGQPYLVLGSASGSSPGFVFGGVAIPLQLDGYTLFSLTNPNAPPLQQSLGLLDAQGRATAKVVLPPETDPSLANLTLQHSFALIDGASIVLLSASNAAGLTLVP